MKKTSLIVILLMFIAIGLFSCRTHELCPAYSKANKAGTEKKG
ncbi:MAG: hypothetical protein WCM76_09400 [Bacteroidota bacterium]